MRKSTQYSITISMLSAVAIILMFIKFPLPFLPPYLTLDFSDLPTLLATFLLSPVAGILVALIKNIINFALNVGDPIGPLANFFAATSFVLAAYYVSKNKETTKRLVLGLTGGTLVMTLVLSILNYFVLLPLYGLIMNLSDVVANIKAIIVSGVIPFNLIKGFILSVAFLLIFKRIKHARAYHLKS